MKNKLEFLSLINFNTYYLMEKKSLLSIGMLVIALIISSCNSKKNKSNDLENDKLLGKVKRVVIKHSGAFTKQEVFTYNLDGYKILEESSSTGEYEDENGYPNGSDSGTLVSYGLIEEKTEYLRDAKNNIIEKTRFMKTPVENYKMIEKYKYNYDENGNIVSEIEIYQNEENLVNYKNKYDKKNNLIECLNVTSNSKKTYKYDDDNNIIEYLNNKNKTTYKYDDNNNKLYEGGFEINSGGSKEFKYDDNNYLLEEITYSSQNKIEDSRKYMYVDNKLTEVKLYNDAGVLSSTITYSDYDNQGNWTKRIESGEMIYNTERIIEYYSEIEENTQSDKTEEKINENEENSNIRDNSKKNLTFGEIRGSIISGSRNEVENFLGQADGEMNCLEYAQDVLGYERLGVVWMEKLIEYRVWIYKSPDNTGKELLVIFHCDTGGGNCKVMKVVYSENIGDFRDLYN